MKAISIHSVLGFIRPDWNNFTSIKDWSTEFIFIFIINNIRKIIVFSINLIYRGPLHLLKQHHTSTSLCQREATRNDCTRSVVFSLRPSVTLQLAPWNDLDLRDRKYKPQWENTYHLIISLFPDGILQGNILIQG